MYHTNLQVVMSTDRSTDKITGIQTGMSAHTFVHFVSPFLGRTLLEMQKHQLPSSHEPSWYFIVKSVASVYSVPKVYEFVYHLQFVAIQKYKCFDI